MAGRGTCIVAWIEDEHIQGTAHRVKPVMCSAYQNVLESLLTIALSDPESLSSTDRNTILSAIQTPNELITATRFLVSEWIHREVQNG